jgi:sn-glycerol 3-phosphate transport system ATP-binding protein
MHEGRAAQIGTPMEVWARPADTYVASFIGSPAMNFLPATLVEGGAAARLPGGAVWRFVDGARPGGDGHAITLGIRPEHLLPDGEAGLPVTLELAEPLGSETVLHTHLADGTPITARVPGATATETLRLAPDLAALHVFDAATGKRIDPD